MNTIKGKIQIKILDSLDAIPASKWDVLIRNNYPFLKHAFLSALERKHCVGPEVGWIPRHLCCFLGHDLAAAMPLYEKHNSWGEFVFDHVWADAYLRHGIPYYPKLLNAIPFTPVTGQRILVEPRNAAAYTKLLVTVAQSLMNQGGYSSIHCLFPDQTDIMQLEIGEAATRIDCQFHWHNRDYQSFEDFLATLKSRKRKKIRHERQRVKESGTAIRWLDGCTASEQDWRDFLRVYHCIYNRKYGMPAFNLEFFTDVGNALSKQVLLVLASYDGEVTAGALMYRDNTTLYGRHWGCSQYIDCLHFELCYYQGIEYCIREGLKKFDPGAQGEHKVARGFEPERTQSLHWIADNQFREAIKQFTKQEQTGVQRYLETWREHTPFHAYQ